MPLTAGCSVLRDQEQRNERTVAMTADFQYAPETVTVPTDGTVVWFNESDVGHTVTAYEQKLPDGAAYFTSGGFSSEHVARNHPSEGLIEPNGRFEHTFERPGKYEYFCIPHEGIGMVGSVRVR